MKTDGFYYVKTKEYSEILKDSFTNYRFTFYYKDGTVIKRFESPSLDKEILEINIKNQIEIMKKDKTYWGIYTIQGKKLVCEGWNSSVGGGLSRSRVEGYLKNDSTIVWIKSFSFDNKSCPKIKSDFKVENYFYPYPLKPDSSNVFLLEY